MSEGLTMVEEAVIENVDKLWEMPEAAFLGDPRSKLHLYASNTYRSICLGEGVHDSAETIWLQEAYVARLLGNHYTTNMSQRVLFEYLRYLSGNRVRLPLKRIHKLRGVEACHSAFLKSEKNY